MSYYSNTSNDGYFNGFLDVNTSNPSDAAFARMWNAEIRKQREQDSMNNYGSSLPVTTCNWGTISNSSAAFSSSYWG